MIGVITGLEAEARLLAGGPFKVACAHGSAAKAARLARRLSDEGVVEGLVSFGIAGGLAPGLKPGTLVLASEILDETGRHFPVNHRWHTQMAAALPGILSAPVTGLNRPLGTTAAKADLHRRQGAVAVDMESHEIAAAAARRAIPFLALRVIADPAERALPDWLAGAITDRGEVSPPRLAGTILLHPRLWGSTLVLARDLGAALRALRHAATALKTLS